MSSSPRYLNDKRFTFDWFVHEVANRAGFSLGDVRLIYNTIVDVISDVIRVHGYLSLRKLFTIHVYKMRPTEYLAKGSKLEKDKSEKEFPREFRDDLYYVKFAYAWRYKHIVNGRDFEEKDEDENLD